MRKLLASLLRSSPPVPRYPRQERSPLNEIEYQPMSVSGDGFIQLSGDLHAALNYGNLMRNIPMLKPNDGLGQMIPVDHAEIILNSAGALDVHLWAGKHHVATIRCDPDSNGRFGFSMPHSPWMFRVVPG